ncbi:MAG: hypothetical protein FJ030_06510 [Chloroflexi bacterium]|nr:hypothetical protein [Chloroflexota bacterium]
MLTQAEIDALLSGIIESEQQDPDQPPIAAERPAAATDSAASGEPAQKQVRLYNFWSPDRFSKDQMRAVELVHEELAERLTSSLPSYLRAVFRPRLIHIEQGRFDDLAQDIPANTLYNILAFDPLPGRALLIFSPEVAWVVLERLLGGTGRTPPPSSKPLTDIGQSLIRGTVEYTLNDVKAAWSKVVTLEPRLEDATVNNLWVTMLMRNARVVLIAFELLIQGVTGTMSIYIPLSMLKPVAGALNPTAWMAGHEHLRGNDEARQAIVRSLRETHVPLTVELGATSLTVRQLTKLTPGDVLCLDTTIQQKLNMKVGTRPRYQVVPGTLGTRMVVRIAGNANGS